MLTSARRWGSPSKGVDAVSAFHVGVIEWLAEHDLVPHAVAGASSGALIAGGIAIGRVADLRAVWAELFGSRVCELTRPLSGRWPYRMSEIVGGVAGRYFGDRLLAQQATSEVPQKRCRPVGR